MLYDTHCHPNLAKNKDKFEIIKNFLEENPEGFLNIIWTDLDHSKNVCELSTNSSRTFCSIWIHPSDILNLDLEKSILYLKELLNSDKNKKIISIWETWLDYYWLKPENDKNLQKYKPEDIEKIIKLKKDLQKIFFRAQIELARKYKLPIIIHNRDSKDDIYNILVESNFKNFIFHCYSENLEYAKKILKFSPNCKISFSGIVTFKNAKDIQETAKNIPLKNILVETDSPYLTPTPFRWKEENEPSFSKYVLDKIIELRDEDPEIIKKQIFQNSIEIFWIKKKV